MDEQFPVADCCPFSPCSGPRHDTMPGLSPAIDLARGCCRRMQTGSGVILQLPGAGLFGESLGRGSFFPSTT